MFLGKTLFSFSFPLCTVFHIYFKSKKERKEGILIVCASFLGLHFSKGDFQYSNFGVVFCPPIGFLYTPCNDFYNIVFCQWIKMERESNYGFDEFCLMSLQQIFFRFMQWDIAFWLTFKLEHLIKDVKTIVVDIFYHSLICWYCNQQFSLNLAKSVLKCCKFDSWKCICMHVYFKINSLDF